MEKYSVKVQPDYVYDDYKILVSYTIQSNLFEDILSSLKPLIILSIVDHTKDNENDFDYSLETEKGTVVIAYSRGIFEETDAWYIRTYPDSLSIYKVKQLLRENSKFEILEDEKHPAFEYMQLSGWVCLLITSILLFLIAKYGNSDTETEIRGFPLAMLALGVSAAGMFKFGAFRYVTSRTGSKFPEPINLNSLAFCLVVVLGLLSPVFIW